MNIRKHMHPMHQAPTSAPNTHTDALLQRYIITAIDAIKGGCFASLEFI